MKRQVLFSLKENEIIFMNVVCCSRDWRYNVFKCTRISFREEIQRWFDCWPLHCAAYWTPCSVCSHLSTVWVKIGEVKIFCYIYSLLLVSKMVEAIDPAAG